MAAPLSGQSCALLLCLLLTACKDAAPEPSFRNNFEPVGAELLSRSSPALADLNGDGVDDIVFGTGVERLQPGAKQYVLPGEPQISGYVHAVSGADNKLLWRAPNPRDAFTTPRFTDLNGDGTPDVLMGGREGSFGAFNGRDGSVLWRVTPALIARTRFPYNFFTPAVVEDQNKDGVVDVLVVYGGDDTRLPNTPRDPSYIALVSGKDGDVLAVQPTPDGAESYSSVVVYQRRDGTNWFVFGTGGETHGGAAYRAPVRSLMDGSFRRLVELLIDPGRKGVMAPATVVEITNDGEPDLAIATFDGRLIVIDGASGSLLWQYARDGEESYHQPAVARIARNGRLGFIHSTGLGEFPRYTGTAHRIFDAVDGRQYLDYRDSQYPAGAPLAVDLSGDGIDEPIFFSFKYPAGQGGRMYIVHGPSKQVLTHDFGGNLNSTPLIADPRNTGSLELIGLAWGILPEPSPPTWRNLRTELFRIDLSAPPPRLMAWAGYMGSQHNGIFTPRSKP